MADPVTLVVQSTASHEFRHLGREVVLSYQLASPLRFKEPHFGRLLWLGGDSTPTLVFANFIELQQVNGQQAPFLGCSASGGLRDWVPLASDYIPDFGFLTIQRANNSSIPKNKKWTVVIQIASKTWIHGASRENRV